VGSFDSYTTTNRLVATALPRKCKMLRLEKRHGQTTARALTSIKTKRLVGAVRKPLVRAMP